MLRSWVLEVSPSSVLAVLGILSCLLSIPNPKTGAGTGALAAAAAAMAMATAAAAAAEEEPDVARGGRIVGPTNVHWTAFFSQFLQGWHLSTSHLIFR